MKKLYSSVLVAVMAMATTVSTFGQKGGGGSGGGTVVSGDWFNTAPVIPLSSLVKGRQGVADNLMTQIGRVDIQYGGRSVVAAPGQNHTTLWLGDLGRLGYTHVGMFTELSDAIASMAFSGQVVPTPQGYYDVNVTVEYYTTDGRLAMTGHGNVPVSDDGNGGLTGGTFEPWMAINEQLAVRVYGMIGAAQWVGKAWGQLQSLQFSYDGVNTLILIPASILSDGYLEYTDQSGNIVAWDLKAGYVLQGKQLLAFMGQSNSSDIRKLQNPTNFDAAGLQFYQSNGYVYGRFPLTDLVTDQPLKQIVAFSVPVWGAGFSMVPTAIYITPIYFNGPNNSAYSLGVESPLEWNNSIGGWIMAIPSGGYHVRVVFDNLLDWENDPYSKG